MKAEVVHEYGGPEVLKYESVADPVPGAGELLIRVAATSVNPVDFKRRSGEAAKLFPLHFPDIVGVDVSGTVEAIGAGVETFKVGDRVFSMAQKTYAELCVVNASAAARLPEGVDLIEAARIPLVVTTGHLAVSRLNLPRGSRVVITGATGSVGRAAVYTARELGYDVIAAVRGTHVAEAKSLGVARVVATDDGKLSGLGTLDGVVDLTGGEVAEQLIRLVRVGGAFTSVLQPPKNADDFPSVRAMRVQAEADPRVLTSMTQALQAGKFDLPIEATYKMSEAGRAQAEAEKGGVGKILLVN